MIVGWARDRVSGKDDTGASLVEYALLLALIAVVAIGALTFLGDAVTQHAEQRRPPTSTPSARSTQLSSSRPSRAGSFFSSRRRSKLVKAPFPIFQPLTSKYEVDFGMSGYPAVRTKWRAVAGRWQGVAFLLPVLYRYRYGLRSLSAQRQRHGPLPPLCERGPDFATAALLAQGVPGGGPGDLPAPAVAPGQVPDRLRVDRGAGHDRAGALQRRPARPPRLVPPHGHLPAGRSGRGRLRPLRRLSGPRDLPGR